jgi:hypothetical protein
MGAGTNCIEVCARSWERGWAIVGLFLSVAAGAQEERAATIGVDEIARGAKGYGLSVFSGNVVERFEVEVLGTIRNLSPEVSYILARLEGHGLEESGVIAGMSGSPVFVDGRLAGAVAFSWPFSRGAIAGITPIGAMRELSTLPTVDGEAPARTAAGASQSSDLERLARLDLPTDLLERRLEALAPALAGGARSSVQFSTVGFGQQTSTLLARTLGAVAPAGRAAPDVELDLESGGVVAGVLMDGDLTMTLTGSVTERHGEEILALGHSFLGIGGLRLPMATAEVVTVISSVMSSFKISNVGEVVGAFDQDRLAGMRGRIGLEARTIPVRLAIRGAAERVYELRVADLPSMSPTLIAIGLLEGVTAASFAGGSQGLDLTARIALEGYEDLVLEQSFDGFNAATETAIYLLTAAGYLMQNPLAEVSLDRVDVDLVQSPQPRVANLVAAHAERTQIRPGERVKLNLDLVPYRGGPFRRTIEVTAPADLPAGRYYLFVGDGSSIDGARMLMEPVEPQSFDQALALLRSFHSRQDLVVLGVYRGRGLVVAGEAMPRLPASIRSLWQAASTMSATPLNLAIAQQVSERLDRPIQGLVRIDLEVLRREPLGAGRGEQGAAEAEAGSDPESDAAEERRSGAVSPGAEDRP